MEIEENVAPLPEQEATVKSRRSTKKKTADKADQAVRTSKKAQKSPEGNAEAPATEEVQEISAQSSAEAGSLPGPEAEKKPAKKPQRGGRKKKAVAAPEDADQAAEQAETDQDQKAVPQRRSRKRAASAEPVAAAQDAETAEVQPGSSLESSPAEASTPAAAPASMLFQAPDFSQFAASAPKAATSRASREQESDDELDEQLEGRQRRRSRGRRGKVEVGSDNKTQSAAEGAEADESHPGQEDDGEALRRRRRRRRGDSDIELTGGGEDDPPNTVTRVRAPRNGGDAGGDKDKVAAVKGSTRLEAKKQRRRESRESGRRRHVITEAEFLARRESVDRTMVVRQRDDRIQIGVLEDGVLAEHFVSRTQQDSLIGNVYLGKVQNVLPSMEAAFVDIGRGRNAVLYAGEVVWDAAKLGNSPRRIENVLKSGDSVLVQVTKDPVGQKGARLTSQISLPGRYLVYVPGGSMTGISRKLPDVERNRLKRILKDNLPEGAGVIVRTAAEGASEEELVNDINRLRAQWENIESRANSKKTLAPEMLYAEPDLTIKVVRDVFNEDFSQLVVAGNEAWDTIEAYVTYVAPDLLDRLKRWDQPEDIFTEYRVTEQINKALDRKVFLPSGGSLVIDRTEAMTVIDVNTGKFTGSGGNLEETVTKNNLEAAEEVVRQLRLRDIGGIIVIDFIDMVLESNRDLVLRRLVECLGRDRTKHQVAEVTSLGLIQMTRKRMGTGLLEVFGEQCDACAGRGVVTHEEPVEHRTTHAAAPQSDQQRQGGNNQGNQGGGKESRSEKRRNRQRKQNNNAAEVETQPGQDEEGGEVKAAQAEATRQAFATIAAAAMAAHHPEAEAGDEPSAQPDQQKFDRISEQSPAPSETGQAGSGADESHAVLTFGADTVELPRAEKSAQEPAAASAPQPELTLDRLSDVFDHMAPEPEGAASQDSDGGVPEEAAGRPRARRRRAAGRAQGAANSTALDAALPAAQGTESSSPEPEADASQSEVPQRRTRKPRSAQAPKKHSGKSQDAQKAAQKETKPVVEPMILGVGVPASEL
ncbi:Rne/Rng family ribonuclease [Acaricomes phytoseiuli]|uniref:Rne/Rng family ribonuclease n=1 Tax=Acaricomes phytoseiuli TaxID=291968 RepID=UPI000372AECB|nr:Rne/Rng family ribonuclease [Acaricomes phytoseiuli]